jgi:predicted transcriptional regulator
MTGSGSTKANLAVEEGSVPPFADEPARDYASFLKTSETERRLLKERIAEANNGVFISSEAMLRWMESWGADNELPPPEPDVFLPPRRA